MEMAIGVIVMLAIAGAGAYAVLNDEGDTPSQKSNKDSKLDQYLKNVQSKRKPPRKVRDEEVSSYQGAGGTKQEKRAQSKKRRQVRRKEASIWDNLAPKEYHSTLNLVLVIFVGVSLLVGFKLMSVN
jgi:hypothetical protein